MFIIWSLGEHSDSQEVASPAAMSLGRLHNELMIVFARGAAPHFSPLSTPTMLPRDISLKANIITPSAQHLAESDFLLATPHFCRTVSCSHTAFGR